MYKMITAALATVLGFSCTLTAANAQYAPSQYAPYRVGVDGTRVRLQRRIDNGAKSGALTRDEASRLRNKLGRINAMEADMRASDNHVSRRERDKLNIDLARLSADIDRQLSDSETRWNHGDHGNRHDRFGYNNGRQWR